MTRHVRIPAIPPSPNASRTPPASAEYNTWVLRRAGQPPTAYGATGGAPSVASGRLAFVFGLRGAAVSIDTACSSSLVAAHFAAGQIGGGTSSGGVAAGVGLILSPESTAMFAKAGEAEGEAGESGDLGLFQTQATLLNCGTPQKRPAAPPAGGPAAVTNGWGGASGRTCSSLSCPCLMGLPDRLA
jgi:hypothetical protein